MPAVRGAYESVMTTEFREIWNQDELISDSEVTAWVVNPGQSFIISTTILDRFPNLEVLCSPSTGINHIDVKACEKRGIKNYSLLDDRKGLETISASAEFTFLLLLNTLRRLDNAFIETKEGRWRDHEDSLRGNELYGKKVGLIGLGRIGRRMASFCEAFSADVTYYDPYVKHPSLDSISLEQLFTVNDILCICCSLTPETSGMITAQLLNTLKPRAVLINTSRGEIINENDLSIIAYDRPDLRIALDVLTGEVTGTQLDSPLLALHKEGRIHVTPHIAGATIESQEKAARIALGLLRRHLTKH